MQDCTGSREQIMLQKAATGSTICIAFSTGVPDIYIERKTALISKDYMPNKNHRILCMNRFFSKELPNILKGRLFWFRRLHIVQDWFVKSSREMYDVSKERLA